MWPRGSPTLRVRRLAAGGSVNRNDDLFLLDKLERGNMHDAVRGIGQQIQLTA